MSFKLLLGILFAMLVGGIVILGVLSYRNSKILLETAHMLHQSHQVLYQTDEVSSLFKDIQLESNAFYIKPDSAAILPYLKARSEIMLQIDELRHLIAGNKQQKAQVDSLQMLLQVMIEFTDVGLDFDQQYTLTELDQRIQKSFQFREQLRRIISSIKREGQTLLIRRQRDYDVSIEAFNKTYILLLSGIGLLLAATFFSIRYNFNKRIQAEEEQKNASELFAKIFYESPMGIVISRLETGEILDCNKSYTELVKYNKSELIGNTAVKLGIYNTQTERLQMVAGVRDSGIVRDLDIQLKPKGGPPIWVSKSMQVIQIDNEVCLLSAVLDMTAHKEAEQKMKQALETEVELNRLKSNFVTLASHEFRTPLTTILSSASLAEKYAFGANEQKIARHVSRIKASVNLLISILDEFLSLTRIEEKKIEPKLEEINLPEIIEAQCSSLKMFAKNGQEIVYKHIGKEQIYSDPVLLKSILNNLVSNAIKYSGEDNQILVSSTVNSEIKLTVKDFGIGMSADDQTHLFERFFRASNTGDIQGTGLGLHIMKHYIEMLHGSINVQSELGHGSEFEVTFHNDNPKSKRVAR